MHKIQTKVFKFLSLPAICILFSGGSLKAQELQESLAIGDSLFAARQFTQALQVYDAIFETAEMQTPAMLLKMAYIHEGLNKIPDALYYLNLYYLETNDEPTLKKMNDLATKNNLKGYEFGGFEMLVRYYHIFFYQILFSIAGITVLLLGWVGYLRFVKNKFNYRPAITIIALSGILFYLVNFSQSNNLGIIETPNCYLMSGPSSSSDVIDIVKAGHRVQIIDHNDVWLKIKWDGKTAYTKEKNIKKITVL